MEILNPRDEWKTQSRRFEKWRQHFKSGVKIGRQTGSWAADLMTRFEHVGDLGKTSVQLIRGSKSSRNIAQFVEKILYKPLKLSGHLRGNMEDTFLDGIFGHETAVRRNSHRNSQRSYQDAHTAKTRCRRTMDHEFAKTIKGEPRQLVLGIKSDHVPAAISDRAGVCMERDQADASLGQEDQGIDPPEAREV